MYMFSPYRMSTPDKMKINHRPLVIERLDLAILHPRNPRRLDILVLALVVSNDGAQVSLRAGGDVVRDAGVEHAGKYCQQRRIFEKI